MENLNDLLRALVTVIISYHQCQLPTSKDMPNERFTQVPTNTLDGIDWITIEPDSTELMNKKQTDLLTHLSLLINESTAHNKTRESLLRYLLHVIERTLDTIDILNSDLTDFQEHDALIQQPFVALLNNMHQLSYHAVVVEYGNQHAHLPACSSNSKMARCITSFILTPLNITTSTQQDAIRAHTKCLFLGQKLWVTSKKQISAETELQKVKVLLDEQLNENNRLKRASHACRFFDQPPVSIKEDDSRSFFHEYFG